jgi:hypothetical protein
VLGIDNIISSPSSSTGCRRAAQTARRIGLFLACSCASDCCWRCRGSWASRRRCSRSPARRSPGDLILLLGGLFLVWKSTKEMHQLSEGEEDHASGKVRAAFTAIILQIIIIDMVFSLDSIITAVGMVDEVSVMIAAVMVSVGLMMLFARAIGEFVSAHPSIKMLALSFLLVVGVMLIAEGFDHKVPKGTSTSRWRSPWRWRCSTSACAEEGEAIAGELHEPWETWRALDSRVAGTHIRDAHFARGEEADGLDLASPGACGSSASSCWHWLRLHPHLRSRTPARFHSWLLRLFIAAVWPLAIFSRPGRDALRGFPRHQARLRHGVSTPVFLHERARPAARRRHLRLRWRAGRQRRACEPRRSRTHA